MVLSIISSPGEEENSLNSLPQGGGGGGMALGQLKERYINWREKGKEEYQRKL